MILVIIVFLDILINIVVNNDIIIVVNNCIMIFSVRPWSVLFPD
jgi:hypothetical protein